MPMTPKDYNHPLVRRLMSLRQTSDQLVGSLMQRQRAMETAEARRAGGGAQPMSNLKNLPAHLVPGNVGDLNRVVWPFWFTFSAPELAPGDTAGGTFTVSQEASFILMSMSKAVFDFAGGEYTYIDVEDETLGAEGLTFFLRDAQSSRTFMDKTIDMDHVGRPQHPTVFASPTLFVPNSIVEVIYSNTSTTRTYVPFITMFGYRVRVSEAQDILSTVTG